MAALGTLVVNLAANSTQLVKGLSEARGELTAFSVGVVAAAGAAIARFTSVGSQLDDMRQRTGMSVEAISSLGHAATMTDTSIESLQSGLVKMSAFMQQVANGGKSANSTLATLGLTAAELNAATAEDKFKLFAERLAGIDDVGQRAAVAMKIFGKGAIDLLPLLSEGAVGIDALQQEAEKLGLVMSTEDAAAAAAFGDSIDKLIASVDMAAVRIGGVLAPALVAAADTLVTLISENQQFIGAALAMATVIGTVAVAMRSVTLATQAYAKAKAIAMAIGGGPAAWAALAAGVAVATVAVSALAEQFNSHNAAVTSASGQSAKFAASSVSVQSAVTATTAAVAKHQQAMQSLRSQYTSYLPESEQARQKVADIAKAWYAARDAGEQLGLTWDQMKKLQSDTIAGASGFTSAMSGITDELRILRGEATESQISLEKMSEFGVPQANIDKLSEAMAARDALKAKNEQDRLAKTEADRIAEEAERAAEALRQSQQSMADAIIQGLKSPAELLADKVKEIRDLQTAGKLTDDQASAAIAQAERESKKSRGEVGVASAMQRGSSQAFSTVVAASMRGKDPVVAATEKQTTTLVQKLKPKPHVVKVAPEFNS